MNASKLTNDSALFHTLVTSKPSTSTSGFTKSIQTSWQEILSKRVGNVSQNNSTCKSANTPQKVTNTTPKKSILKVIDVEQEEILKQLEKNFARTVANVANDINVQSNSQENGKSL